MVNDIRRASRRLGLSVVWFSCLAGAAQQSIAQDQASQARTEKMMGGDTPSEKEKNLRRDMQKVFDKYPEKFSDEVRKGFAEHRVVIGMDPYLAHLTAGAFVYKVEADPQTWPSHADPMQVMWAQARRPDRSKIWMTFENDTQFPGQGLTKFSAYIENGKVKDIKKI